MESLNCQSEVRVKMKGGFIMPDMNDFNAFQSTSDGSGSSSDFNGLKFILVLIIISIVFGILEALGN
jgi:hypothetical protein